MNAPSPRLPQPRPTSVYSATALVARREITTQLRSKSFIISTIIILAAVLGGIVLSGFLSNRTSDATPVAVVSETENSVAKVEALEPVLTSNETEARAALEEGTVDAAILPAADEPLGFYVLAQDSEPTKIMSELSLTPRVELTHPQSSSHMVRYFVSIIFGMIFMMAAMSFGSTIAQNTVIEKQTRTVELLLAAVPARALLAGKIIGNSVLAIGQTAAIAAVAVIGMILTGQDEVLSMLGAPILWFVLFFVVGFVLLAAIFAASASLVSRMEDTGTVLTPVILLTMLPYIVVTIFPENDLIMTIASYVPFSAPVAMPLRLFMGTASWWEPLLSLAIVAFSAVIAVLIGEKIYRSSLLRTGSRVRLREAIKG